MKTLFCLALTTFLALAANAQRERVLHFVFAGEETKPHGSLVISVNKYVPPNDQALDFFYGQSLRTDEKTFNFVFAYLEQSRFNYRPSKPEDGYWVRTNMEHFIPLQSAYAFFDSLGHEIQSRKLDSAVGDAFMSCPGWKGGKSLLSSTHEDIWRSLKLPSNNEYENSAALSKLILKSQAKLYTDNALGNKRRIYSRLMRFSKEWTPRTVKVFVENESPAFETMDSLNIIEGYSVKESSFVMWIWKSDDRVYQFEYATRSKNPLKKTSLTDMQPIDRLIIEQFYNWNSEAYTNRRSNDVEIIYYLGSKINSGGQNKRRHLRFQDREAFYLYQLAILIHCHCPKNKMYENPISVVCSN